VIVADKLHVKGQFGGPRQSYQGLLAQNEEQVYQLPGKLQSCQSHKIGVIILTGSAKCH
jgi:hypothetical protein